MITLNDVERITIGSRCQETWPCSHESEVVLKDGRTASRLDSFEICAIVSNIAKERINPERAKRNPDKVREHFQEYSDSVPGGLAESPEVVLNRIFHNRETAPYNPEE